jgi:hypothetical protein
VTAWQRDLIGVAGALFVSLGFFLIWAPLGVIVLGGALLWLWNSLVPDQEVNDGA